MDTVCTVCGCVEFEERRKGPHTGLYCTACGKWLKWVAQSEYSITIECIGCKKCGCKETITQQKGPHMGEYCKECGKWVRWVKH